MKMINKNGLPKLLLTGVTLLSMAACAPRDPVTGEEMLRANAQNASMTKQINVQKVTPVFVVKFTPDAARFSDLEKGRLLGFLEAQNARFGDVLEVELPPFSDAAGVNEERFGTIGGFLQDQGYTVEPRLERDGLENSLRIFFTKYVATVDPECAKGWRKPEGLQYESLPLPHMGCSTASNLAQMLSDPKDLIEPRVMGGYDGARAAASIAKYRGGGKGGKKGGQKSGGKK